MDCRIHRRRRDGETLRRRAPPDDHVRVEEEHALAVGTERRRDVGGQWGIEVIRHSNLTFPTSKLAAARLPLQRRQPSQRSTGLGNDDLFTRGRSPDERGQLGLRLVEVDELPYGVGSSTASGRIDQD